VKAFKLVSKNKTTAFLPQTNCKVMVYFFKSYQQHLVLCCPEHICRSCTTSSSHRWFHRRHAARRSSDIASSQRDSNTSARRSYCRMFRPSYSENFITYYI